MARVSGLHVIRESIRTTVERGPTLIVLFLFLGLVSFLAWNGASMYSFQLQVAVAIGALLFWTGAEVISLNTLVDSSTKVKLSSMYLTEYKGIVWTTTAFLFGGLLIAGILAVSSSLSWIVFVLEGFEIWQILLTTPSELSLPQLYTVFLQALSFLFTLYVATRLMLFPALVAVENKDVAAAIKKSAAQTEGHVSHLVLPVLLSGASAPISILAGLLVEPIVTSKVTEFSTQPYVLQIASGGVYTLFFAMGVVFSLSILATAYSQFN